MKHNGVCCIINSLSHIEYVVNQTIKTFHYYRYCKFQFLTSSFHKTYMKKKRLVYSESTFSLIV